MEALPKSHFTDLILMSHMLTWVKKKTGRKKRRGREGGRGRKRERERDKINNVI